MLLPDRNDSLIRILAFIEYVFYYFLVIKLYARRYVRLDLSRNFFCFCFLLLLLYLLCYILVALHLFENSNIFYFPQVRYVSNFTIIKEENDSSLQVYKVLSNGKTNFY